MVTKISKRRPSRYGITPAATPINIPTRVVITTLLHESVLMGQTSSIFKCGLHLDLNYTLVKILDSICHYCNAIALT